MGGLHLNYKGTYVLGCNHVKADPTHKKCITCAPMISPKLLMEMFLNHRGCIELVTLNEENSIQLSNSDNPSLIINELKRKKL